MQNTGVTLTAAAAPADTVLSVSNSLPIKAGMHLQMQSGSAWEVMRVTAKTGDGPGGVTDTLTVERHLRGSVAASYSSGAGILGSFARLNVNVNGITTIDNGAELTATLDAETFEPSDAYLVEPLDSSETQIDVSDSRQFIVSEQVRIDSEVMTVTPNGVSSGLNFDSGAVIEENVLFDAKATIKISNRNALQVGWRLRMASWFDTACQNPGPPEEMLIVGLSGDGPGGAQDTMTVVRGTTILNLLMTSTHPDCAADPPFVPYGSGVIFAGQDRITVASRGMSGVTHNMGVPISIELRTARVNDHTLLSPVEEGLSSTVTIDGEQLKVRDVPSRHFHTSGANLAAGPNGSTTLLRVSDADVLVDGDVIRVDSELMAVHRADPACTLQPAAATIELIDDAVESVVDINDVDNFAVGCTIKMGSEEMRVDQLLPEDLGAIPPRPEDTMTVVRGYNDTTAVSHPAGSVTVDLDSARVTRGMYASSAVGHGNGVAIHELTSEANTVRFQRLSGVTTHSPGASIIDVDGLGAYQVDITTNAATTAATINEFVGPAGAQVTFDVTNPGALQPNWVIIVNNEKMRVVSVDTGAGEITVVRNVHATSLGTHTAGTPIRGPIMMEWTYTQNSTFLGSTGRAVDCSSSPSTLLPQGVRGSCDTTTGPLGATGSGTLLTADVWGHQKLPSAPVQQITLTPLLLDLSGNQISSAPSSTVNMRVLKCTDVNQNGFFTNSDIVLIAQAFFNIIPDNLPLMDGDMNGVLTYGGDVVLQQRIFFFSQPGGSMRCLPPE
jgi:hypothetical protein